MVKSFQIKRLRHIAVIAAMALPMISVLAVSAARAEDDDSIWNLDKKVFKEIRRGMGLKGADDENINYRERSPLVIPPSRALAPPQTSAVESNAAWPVDPDVKARREAKKADAGAGFEAEDLGRVLRPSELEAGRSAAAKARGGRKSPNAPTESSDQSDWNPISPSKLGYVGGLFKLVEGSPKEESIPFKSEPERNSLTEPPPGYQTPSPAFPYGVTKTYELGPAQKLDRQAE
jgi:hypothetical protein